MPSPRIVADRPVNFELRHLTGCPAAEGRLPGDPTNPTNPRKALGIETYVITGTGRYNKVTGEFEAVPKAGIVRCIECAQDVHVDPADVPTIQKMIAAQTVANEETH